MARGVAHATGNRSRGWAYDGVPVRARPNHFHLGESVAQSRPDVAAGRGLTPLVGGEPKVAPLRERWARVKDGLGQVVPLCGKAGIDKSRVVQVMKTHVAVIGTAVGAAAKLTQEIIKRLPSRSSSRQQRGAMQPDSLG